MGIKSRIIKAAGKAGDAVAKVSALSPEQLDRVQAKREEYLSQMPDPNDPTATELTRRLLASCGVEIHNAYLPQIEQLYSPVDPYVEYDGKFDSAHNIRFIEITKWVIDSKENDLNKLISVYDVLSNGDCNIALVFNRKKERSRVYLAVSDASNSTSNVDVENYKRRLCEAVKGNFPGSEFVDGGAGRIPCLKGSEPFSIAAVSNIPTEKSEQFISQTIEKLLDGIVPSRKSEEYTIILLATPILDVEERKLRLAELYTALAPYAGWQTDFHYNKTDSTMSMATVGVNAGVSAGTQQGTNSSLTDNSSVTDSSSGSITDTASTGDTTGSSDFKSTTSGFGVTEGASASVGVNPFGVGASVAGSLSATESLSTTGGSSTSTSHAVSTAKAVGQTLGKAATRGIAKTSGAFNAVNLGANFGASFSRASSVTATIGKNEGITQSFTNFAIKHTLDILEAQMKRLDQASALGMWDFAAYVLSEDVDVANNVAHSYLALTQGEDSYMSQSSVNVWRGDLGEDSDSAATICEYLRDLRHPMFGMNPGLLDVDFDFATYPGVVTATTALSGKELAYSLNFPRKSISGLPVIKCAEFGRNVSKLVEWDADESPLKLGKIFHMHHEESLPVNLDRESLSSHTFITGSTGTGKTNTVCKIIDELLDKNINFMVIEPAKGEYKDIFGGYDDVEVFGTNAALMPLLRINPFSFPEHIHVLEHLDRLVEIFNVCWPMYAAMPAVLKAAVEKSYEDCGWSLVSSKNELDEPAFPNFSDVSRNVKAILDASEYDVENKGAYKGSLLTRIESLTNGIYGMIFSENELSPEVLFDGNTIVDLSRVGSMETKSLLMGLLLLKLQEHRMSESAEMNLPLKHVTVLEEAHNILKRTSTEQSLDSANLLGKSVEMLSNAIAEMRTYGEGFVIVDQAPGLLDMAAIRNTNTKIIMRLPDLSDRQLVGKAASLNDDQITELARLPRGVAAVFQNDWVEPVLCKVDKAENAKKFSYSCGQELVADYNVGLAKRIAGLLANGTKVEKTQIHDLDLGMKQMGIASSTRVAVARTLMDPQSEPRMTKVAPLVSALFPHVKECVAKSVARSKNPRDWTDAADKSLVAIVGEKIDSVTKRVIIQGVITEHLYNELHDQAAFKDWYQNNGLR